MSRPVTRVTSSPTSRRSSLLDGVSRLTQALARCSAPSYSTTRPASRSSRSATPSRRPGRSRTDAVDHDGCPGQPAPATASSRTRVSAGERLCSQARTPHRALACGPRAAPQPARSSAGEAHGAADRAAIAMSAATTASTRSGASRIASTTARSRGASAGPGPRRPDPGPSRVPDDQDARPGASEAGRAEVEGHRQAGAPIGCEPVEEGAAPQAAGRPARHRAPGRQPCGLLRTRCSGRPSPTALGTNRPRDVRRQPGPAACPSSGPSGPWGRPRPGGRRRAGADSGGPSGASRSLPGPGTACPASSTGTPGTLSPHASSSRSRTCER